MPVFMLKFIYIKTEVIMINFYFYQTKIGTITIAEEGEKLIWVGLNGALPKNLTPANSQKKESVLIKNAAAQIKDYLAGKIKKFDLPLAPKGTPFQLKVWNALKKIPYGKTASYKQIAVAAGCPKGFRAVGMANNKNPLPLVIPCHRIIGADGSLTGYGGGLDIKRALLELEKN